MLSAIMTLLSTNRTGSIISKVSSRDCRTPFTRISLKPRLKNLKRDLVTSLNLFSVNIMTSKSIPLKIKTVRTRLSTLYISMKKMRLLTSIISFLE